MKNVALHNLGCKVNAYELDVMRQVLQENDYRIVAFDEKADIYIVNTCSVTNIADRKSRQMLHRAKRNNPDAIVVATGCYVQTGEKVADQDSCIDLLVGNNKKKEIAHILEEFIKSREMDMTSKNLSHRTIIDINHTDEYEEYCLHKTGEHARAYIKIQDGCNQFCTYCIIPYARGRVRSRKLMDIRKEVEALAENGYKEVVLTGIHISSYGVDFEEEVTFLDVLQEIHAIEGIQRIRIGSLEPRIITKEFAAQLAAMPKLCPHFHLSLQSGSKDVLTRMNRRYTPGEYYEKVALLRTYFENPAITTDVIVGFPGETDAEFLETIDFCEKVDFFEMHVFKYSKRDGTKAAEMPNQIPDSKKEERSKQLIVSGELHERAYRDASIGKEVEVLFEEEKEIDGKHYLLGYTKEYIRVACNAEIPCNIGEIGKFRLGKCVLEDIMEIIY